MLVATRCHVHGTENFAEFVCRGKEARIHLAAGATGLTANNETPGAPGVCLDLYQEGRRLGARVSRVTYITTGRWKRQQAVHDHTVYCTYAEVLQVKRYSPTLRPLGANSSSLTTTSLAMLK